MEDSVIVSERLAQLNVNLSKPTDEEKQEDQERGVENHESGSLLNQLLSNLTSPRARDVHVEKVDDQVEEEKREVELDSGGGGVLNNLISNFFHQNEGEEKKEEGKVDEGREVQVKVAKEEDEKEASCGMINNLICNLFHPSEGGSEVDEKKEEGKVDEEDEKEQSGGIINNIVSSMPEELVADSSDEASFLMHSIIHDCAIIIH